MPRKRNEKNTMNTSFSNMLDDINESYCSEVPPIIDTHTFIDDLVHLLFPIMENKKLEREVVEERFKELHQDLMELLIPMKKTVELPLDEIVQQVFAGVPNVYEMLVEDAKTVLDSDPAANCLEEVIVCYPGFYALTIHRLAHLLYEAGVPFLPRVISEYAHAKTGIDIHPGATIGRAFYIDHGTGIVIGETAVVGNHVKIYQGVTLGATFVEKRLKHTKRHPTLEDNVIIYAGSTILGKDTVIGHDTTIGGNVWLTDSVPAYSTVYRQQQSVIRDSRKNSRTTAKEQK